MNRELTRIRTANGHESKTANRPASAKPTGAAGYELTRMKDLAADGSGCMWMRASFWSLRACCEGMNSPKKAQKAQKRFTPRSVPGVHARSRSFAAFK
jgi:hypothetical protein